LDSITILMASAPSDPSNADLLTEYDTADFPSEYVTVTRVQRNCPCGTVGIVGLHVSLGILVPDVCTLYSVFVEVTVTLVPSEPSEAARLTEYASVFVPSEYVTSVLVHKYF